MTEFERLLTAFRNGKTDLESLQISVDSLTGGSSGPITDALLVLEAARSAGLAKSAYTVLRRRLTALSGESATMLGVSPNVPVDDSTTAMYRGLGEREGPTELNPAAGYNDAEIAKRRVRISEDPHQSPRQDENERPDPTITDIGVVDTGEEPTGTMWPGLYNDSGLGLLDREFQKGEVLRGRFELIAKLGEGGMGAVWKGKDLLKEEAKDRNPYVAIKLLQADFKRHPEAFIALQRETSKQQRLAHPNIATVYDFDRDERTHTVFMTMEVMEGQPMDAFIRALPADGLAVDEAMGIIEQLGAGLAYAHDNGLVHSDLKPGNCFMTSGETVKLLDFGIARASKSKSDEEEGETTLFDPAELGALTPTYATLEMFEGEDPDPRDDIFALAILAYQLFTGRHPYGKKSAPKAQELGLRPARVAKLSNRQNRGLARGLALHRGQRTATVERFLDDIRRRHSTVTYAVSAAVAALLLIGVLSYKPILDVLDRRQHEDIIATLERPGMENIRNALGQAAILGEPKLSRIMEDPRTRGAIIAHIGQAGDERLDQWLAFVRTFSPELKRDILGDERAHRAIVEHFEERIFAAFDPARRRYDFARAHRNVSTLEAIYPDSAAALKIRGELQSRRKNALDRLGNRFNRYLEAGLLIPDESRQYIGDVLDAVRRMEPTYHLLNDDRLRLRYGELAEAALKAGDDQRAAALVRAGLEYAPGDPALINLRFQVQMALARAANLQRVTDVEARLASSEAKLQTMSDFSAHREDLLVLARLAPDSPILARTRARLEQAMDDALRHLFDARSVEHGWHEGWQLLLDHAPLLRLDYLRDARERLPDSVSVAGDKPTSAMLDDGRIVGRVDAITTLLENPGSGSVWQAALERPYKELLVLLPAGHDTLLQQRDRIAEHFLFEARAARRAASFDEALSYIETGRVFHPGFPPYDLETLGLTQAQADLRARRDTEQLAAQIVSMKADFHGKAETDQVQEAKAILKELRALGLDDDDEFLRDEATRGLADAYARLAATRAVREDYPSAAALARAGLEQWPEHTELRARLAGYEIAIENERFQDALRIRLSDPQPLDVPASATDLARLQARYPNRFDGMATELAALRKQAVLEHARSAQPIGDQMARQLSVFDALFPAHRGRLAADLAETVARRIRRLEPATIDDIAALRPVIDNIAELPRAEAARLRAVLAESVIVAARSRALRDPDGARRVLLAAQEMLAQPGLLTAARELPLPELQRARDNFGAGALSAAARDLDSAEKKDPEHPDIAALGLELDSAMEDAQRAYARYAADIEKTATAEQRLFDDRYSRIVAQWRDNADFQRLSVPTPRKGECHETLAGYGARAGGTCYDLVAGRKGPEMVVIPAGNGLDKSYAIGKYEVSVVDFNHFCEQSQRCRPRNVAGRRLPVTEIAVGEAEDYARWLSREASANNGHRIRYRLPTAAEWRHAAQADGRQPERNFNCRVSSAGEVIAGHALVNARSGGQNGWGLTNYAGNARELVRGDNAVTVHGGAFSDPLTECGPDLGESHSGEADALTGFRLVRELG